MYGIFVLDLKLIKWKMPEAIISESEEKHPAVAA
jgi:hypothetical protein